MRSSKDKKIFGKKKRRKTRRKSSTLFVDAKTIRSGFDPSTRFWVSVFFLAVAVGIVAFGLYKGAASLGNKLFVSNPAYNLKHIKATTDGDIKPEQLVRYAEVQTDTNLFGFKLNEVQERLEEEAKIKSARVRRQLPDTLMIEISERTPIACVVWGVNARNVIFQLVDGEGIIIGRAAQVRHLPMIKGLVLNKKGLGDSIYETRAREALEALTYYNEQRFDRFMEIREISVGMPDFLSVVLKSGCELRIPRNNIQLGLSNGVAYLRKEEADGNYYRRLDLVPSVDRPIGVPL